MPVCFASTVFAEVPSKSTIIELSDAVGLGKGIVEALDCSEDLMRGKTHNQDFVSSSEAFHENMERFRKSIGCSTARFARETELIAFTRQEGQLEIERMKPVHGKFAYEGSGKAPSLIELPEALDKRKIGLKVQSLLR